MLSLVFRTGSIATIAAILSMDKTLVAKSTLSVNSWREKLRDFHPHLHIKAFNEKRFGFKSIGNGAMHGKRNHWLALLADLVQVSWCAVRVDLPGGSSYRESKPLLSGSATALIPSMCIRTRTCRQHAQYLIQTRTQPPHPVGHSVPRCQALASLDSTQARVKGTLG